MFCRFCGTELGDGAMSCTKCGKPVPEARPGSGNWASPAGDPENGDALVAAFSKQVKTNAIIWLVIGALQFLLGLSSVLLNVWVSGEQYTGWVFLIVGSLNLFFAITDLEYSKNVLRDPKGIVDRVKPLARPILTLVYNLLFGGVIGVAGSIYYLIAIRGFVIGNEPRFREIENNLQL